RLRMLLSNPAEEYQIRVRRIREIQGERCHWMFLENTGYVLLPQCGEQLDRVAGIALDFRNEAGTIVRYKQHGGKPFVAVADPLAELHDGIRFQRLGSETSGPFGECICGFGF